MADAEGLRAEKAALRARAEAVRARLGVDPEAPARRLAGLLGPETGRRLSGYWPMRGEADPRPAMAAHAGPLCLPVVAGRGRPLMFRAWAPGAALVAGGYGAMVPAEGAAEVVPEVLIVPLLAFDRQGYRLGYGGGFYDRTLAALRARGPCRAIGLAFAGQEVGAVPRAATDLALDLVVTEAEILVPQPR